MEHPPQARHEALQPLSREHFGGLRVARDLRIAATEGERRAAVERFVRAWEEELRPHFEDEERLLLPLVGDAATARRLCEEHRAIAEGAAEAAQDVAGVAADAARVRGLGDMLHDHIRWEERVMFPAVQDQLGEQEAARLEEQTRAIARPGALRWGETRD